MKFIINFIALLAFLLTLYSCENDKTIKNKIVLTQEEIQNELQKQLDEEFGKYIEEVKTEDRKYYKAYDKALKLWNIPLHELYVETSFGKAHVIVCGPKNTEPVVLLHGMNASSTMWYPNIKALSQNHRVYAIDYLLEPGKSQVNRKVKDINEVINWYYEIFDQLKLDKFSIIGASKGGWLAMKIALQQRSRVSNLVLLSPAHAFIWIRPGTKMLSNLTYTMDPKRKRLRSVLETLSVHVDSIKQAYIDQYFIATENVTNNKFILQMTPFSNNELKNMTMPVLLLVGDHDIINNEKSIEEAKVLIPHSETGIIKDSGHFLSFDQPDIINKRILDFLNEKHEAPIVAKK